VLPEQPESATGWADDELLATAHDFLGVGSDAGLPDDVRFRAGVIRLITNRLQVRTSGEKGQSYPPAIFLLLPRSSLGALADKVRTEPMIDSGVAHVEGCIWLVNSAVGSGIGVELASDVADWSDDAAFRAATDLFQAGGVPAIVFETRTPKPEARFYPRGLEEPDAYELLRLGGNPISLADVFEVIDTVYHEGLVTPDAQGVVKDLWSDADKHWVATQAEARIQYYLRIAFRTHFPACRVSYEQPQPAGRYDLELLEVDAVDKSILIRHVLLELKVLRSFWNTGGPVGDQATQEWVAEGVRQAAAYRDELDVRAAAVCCFDMRKVTTFDCLAAVKTIARRRKISLRSWRLYASAKAYRAAREAEALA
jgi:hypothetical protein